MMSIEQRQEYFINKIAESIHSSHGEKEEIKAKATEYYITWFELSGIDPDEDNGIYRNTWIPAISKALLRLREDDERRRKEGQAYQDTINTVLY